MVGALGLDLVLGLDFGLGMADLPPGAPGAPPSEAPPPGAPGAPPSEASPPGAPEAPPPLIG